MSGHGFVYWHLLVHEATCKGSGGVVLGCGHCSVVALQCEAQGWTLGTTKKKVFCKMGCSGVPVGPWAVSGGCHLLVESCSALVPGPVGIRSLESQGLLGACTDVEEESYPSHSSATGSQPPHFWVQLCGGDTPGFVDPFRRAACPSGLCPLLFPVGI